MLQAVDKGCYHWFLVCIQNIFLMVPFIVYLFYALPSVSRQVPCWLTGCVPSVVVFLSRAAGIKLKRISVVFPVGRAILNAKGGRVCFMGLGQTGLWVLWSVTLCLPDYPGCVLAVRCFGFLVGAFFFSPLFIVLFQLADPGLSYLSAQLVSRLKNMFAYLSWKQACQVSALCSIT